MPNHIIVNTVEIMGTALTIAALTVGLPLTLQAAQIANGGQQMAPHIFQGWVVGVRQGNGGGVLRIRSAQVINNAGAANMQGVAPVVQMFAIGPGTHFEVARGMNRMPASAAMLRPGQRVMVQVQGQQAIGVRILARSQNVSGRRGVYYAGRGPQVRGNRATQVQAIGGPPNAAKGVGANLHHASVTRRAARVAPKKG